MAPVLVAAQCVVRAGDVEANLAMHLDFMQRAGELGATLVVFPELSLTGYEPALASVLAQPAGSHVLDPLRRLARDTALTTVVGMPLWMPGRDKPLIASWILYPDGSLGLYTKQHLHAGEEASFCPGLGGELLRIGDLPVALSICADFSQAEHPARAAAQGAQLYVTSALIGEGGYGHDSALLQGHAQRHLMALLMANHGGPTGGWVAAGRSAFWDEQGRCVAATAGPGNRLLVITRQADGWLGRDMPLSC